LGSTNAADPARASLEAKMTPPPCHSARFRALLASGLAVGRGGRSRVRIAAAASGRGLSRAARAWLRQQHRRRRRRARRQAEAAAAAALAAATTAAAPACAPLTPAAPPPERAALAPKEQPVCFETLPVIKGRRPPPADERPTAMLAAGDVAGAPTATAAAAAWRALAAEHARALAASKSKKPSPRKKLQQAAGTAEAAPAPLPKRARRPDPDPTPAPDAPFRRSERRRPVEVVVISSSSSSSSESESESEDGGSSSGSDGGSSLPSTDAPSTSSVLSARAFGTLRPRRWLNDEAINGYFALIQQRAADAVSAAAAAHHPHPPLRVACLTSYFFELLTSSSSSGRYDYDAVRRCTMRAPYLSQPPPPHAPASPPPLLPLLARCDLLLAPVHVGGAHWVLAAVWPGEGLVEVYDTLPEGGGGGGADDDDEEWRPGKGGGSRRRRRKHRRRQEEARDNSCGSALAAARVFARWLEDEARDKGVRLPVATVRASAPRSPAQRDSCSCGVLVCAMAERLAAAVAGPLMVAAVSGAAAALLRLGVARELVAGRLQEDDG